MKHIEPPLKSLVEHNVEFVIIGGVAIIAHGVPYATFDLDFCYARTSENLKKNRCGACSSQSATARFSEGFAFHLG